MRREFARLVPRECAVSRAGAGLRLGYRNEDPVGQMLPSGYGSGSPLA